MTSDDKKQAKDLGKQLGATVEYAPWWVRILSAVCLGVGTMIGYPKIVTTLGRRLASVHLYAGARGWRPPERGCDMGCCPKSPSHGS